MTMARANPGWGYTRIRGALYNLAHEIGRNTIKRLLSNGESLCEGSRDRGKAHRDAKLLEFGVDLPRSPGILGGEPTNEFPHFRGDARSAGIRAASVPGPIRNDELPASIGQRTVRREVAPARDMDGRLVQASLLRDVMRATGPGA